MTAAYIYTLLRLPWLAPDITAAIVDRRRQPQRQNVDAQGLAAPANWTEQRTLLGF